MRRIFLVMTLVLLFQSGTDIVAQDKSLVKLSGENVTTGTQVYEYVREANGQETAIGTITENIEKDGERLVIAYQQDLPNMLMKDTLKVDFGSFLPKSYQSVLSVRQNIQVKYNGTEGVNVRIKRRSFGVNQDTSFSAKFDQLRYDSHWLPTLLYAVEKEGNTNWEIPVYSHNNSKDIIKIKVLGEEKVTVHDKDRNTVKYEISRANSPDIYHYWIDKQTNRMLQTRGEINPTLFVWLRIKAEV